jgi:hypothetical protein
MNLRAKISEHVKHINKLNGIIVYKRTEMFMEAIVLEVLTVNQAQKRIPINYQFVA